MATERQRFPGAEPWTPDRVKHNLFSGHLRPSSRKRKGGNSTLCKVEDIRLMRGSTDTQARKTFFDEKFRGMNVKLRARKPLAKTGFVQKEQEGVKGGE